MKPLQWRIESNGFPTTSFGYASYRGSLLQHARRLRSFLDALSNQHEKFHVVAHSMGCIVFRLAIAECTESDVLAQLGRVVMLAPPNQGTPTARWINPLFCLFCRGVSELSDKQESLVHQIESNPMDLGVVAGNYDWVVPRDRTHLPSQRDHVTLRSTHNSMLLQRSATQQIVSFLESGHFQH